MERDTSKLAPGVHITQAQGVRGLRFSAPHPSMTFSSSELLVNCDLFPKEFSIVVTLSVGHTDPMVKYSLSFKCLLVNLFIVCLQFTHILPISILQIQRYLEFDPVFCSADNCIPNLITEIQILCNLFIFPLASIRTNTVKTNWPTFYN